MTVEKGDIVWLCGGPCLVFKGYNSRGQLELMNIILSDMMIGAIEGEALENAPYEYIIKAQDLGRKLNELRASGEI